MGDTIVAYYTAVNHFDGTLKYVQWIGSSLIRKGFNLKINLQLFISEHMSNKKHA